MRYSLVAGMLIIGCATTPVPCPAPPERPRCPVKTDLGCLDDIDIQRRVAAREEYRRRLKAINDRCIASEMRARAYEEAPTRALIDMQSRGIRIASCTEETQLLSLSGAPLPNDFLNLKTAGARLAILVERGGYVAGDRGIESEFELLEKKTGRVELGLDLVQRALSRLFRCQGVEMQITNPIDGSVLFRTDRELQRLDRSSAPSPP
jgi:hypothetical protein